ncbi:hypothetical protein SAMN04490244_10374 [Tranquillimonas rosea]|uniref:Lipase (Class 3) n=1 Tax=Tranquillimonas rosea TaxID=641238 RepID=A0A1H9S892_9RHOB|nr:hypothetical protein [Tranquillimonas rosea]SER81220.1 hypothetical protein SAMN04490244_10374 [Tranquillimonas rosea]
MKSLSLLEAAQMMLRVYDRDRDPELEIVQQIDIRGVQACTLKGGILVIPGTNEFSDWFQFNFDLGGRDRVERHGFAVAHGDSGARWHGGFLEHAQIVYTFAKPQPLRYIIGHSLGAASAQIVGASLKLPTIALASPRTLRGDRPFPGEGWVVNVCRTDDTVCHVPPDFMGFRHLGSVYWLSPPEVNVGEDHRVDKYIALMEAKVSPTLPQAWPRAA